MQKQVEYTIQANKSVTKITVRKNDQYSVWCFSELATFQQWAKGSGETVSEGPTVLNIWGTSPDMTTVFHTWACGRFIEI